MASNSLLPQSRGQFRSKAYWDEFFLARGTAAFEWYGKYEDFANLLVKKMKRTDAMLVIGCGNSDFSTRIYDDGFTKITNVDFSEPVIREMRLKSANRKEMKWLVGDMTNMTFCADSSFKWVFDKGALDALLSEDTVEYAQTTHKMFRDIERVLEVNGRYVCISLAQDFVFREFLTYFASSNNNQRQSFSWNISIEAIAQFSPFIPFFLTATKVPRVNEQSETKIEVKLNSLGETIDTSDLRTPSECLDLIRSIQEHHEQVYNLSELKEGRFESIDYWSKESNASPRFTLTIVDRITPTKPSKTCAVLILPVGRETEYQFSSRNGLLDLAQQADCARLITVRLNKPHTFDAIKEIQNELSPTVLHLVPRCMDKAKELIPYMALAEESGWSEVEYGFSVISGDYIVEEKEDKSSANTAIFRRLIFVQNQNFIQTETRLIKTNATLEIDPTTMSKTQIKLLKKKQQQQQQQQGVEFPVKVSLPSASSMDDIDDDDSNNNRPHQPALIPSLVFDGNYLDSHHKATLSGMSLLSRVSSLESKESSQLNQDVGLIVGLGGGSLVMALQRLFPSLTLLVCELDEQVETVGKKYFGFVPSERTYVAIDDGVQFIQDMVSLCAPSATPTKPKAMENRKPRDAFSLFSILQQQQQQQQHQLSFVMLDVDGKDSSLGLSAPPPQFLQLALLRDIHTLLRPGGLLVINVVARGGEAPIEAVVRDVRSVFCNDKANIDVNNNEDTEASNSASGSASVANGGQVFLVKPNEETVNVLLIAVKANGEDNNSLDSLSKITTTEELLLSVTAVSKSKKKKGKQRQARMTRGQHQMCETNIRSWLARTYQGKDPLQLLYYLDKFETR